MIKTIRSIAICSALHALVAEVYDVTDDIWARPGYQAYTSINYMRLMSGGGMRIKNMLVHEQFPSANSWQACGDSSGWTEPIPQTAPDPRDAWGYWLTNENGEFTNLDGNPAGDGVGYGCVQGTCSPVSNFPGTKRNPPQPLSTKANSWSYHHIYVGSQDTVNLGKYVAVKTDKQARYTDHGRDEPQEWSCPVQ